MSTLKEVMQKKLNEMLAEVQRMETYSNIDPVETYLSAIEKMQEVLDEYEES
jgi:hypothetical protein